MLVDEVEPEEAVAVHAAGVAQAGEDVPGRGDGEEEEEAGEGPEGAPVAVFAGEREVERGGAEEEDERDEAFGEDGEGECSPHGVGVERCDARSRSFASLRMTGMRGATCEEAVERGGEQQREQDIGDEDAGEEEDAGGGEDGEAGVEGGAVAEGLACPAVAEQHQQQHGDRLGQVDGEGVEAEDADAGGGDPVGQRRLLQVADVVDAQGDQVAGEQHLAGGVGVGAVGVVEHGRREEGSDEERQPER